nr:cobalamin adenosyltransferase [Clostridium tetanomorphum]
MDEYVVSKDTLVTPSARQYLNERNIKLVIKEEKEKENTKNSIVDENKDKYIMPKYVSMYSGGYFEKKPEHMTQLLGNKLVFKTHPRIVLRGKIDSLESRILQVQILANKERNEKLVKDLEEVIYFVRNILRSEVLEEEIKDFILLGMNESEMREMSHYPKKYFNVDHILPSYKMGEILVELNSLRSYSREVEIAALNAFKNEEGEIKRNDIIQCLNRLSSCFYIMMCKHLAGQYK